MKKMSEQFPIARKEDVLVEKLSDEVLVYDLVRKKAHCLNLPAALIWDHCDGKTGVKEIARILADELSVPVDEEMVWFGLREIGRNHLLEKQVPPPSAKANAKDRMSRRELIKRVGLAVSVPLVVSVLAPTASASLSCVGAFCTSSGPNCKAPCTCNTSTNKCQ